MGVRIDHDGLVALTAALVRVPSVNRPAEGLSERPAADLVAQRMRDFGWDPVVEEVAPGRPNVVAVIQGGGDGPTLLFAGHTDVVTEGDRGAWTREPFGGEISDGRLHGRGAADMKGGLAAMLYAAKAVQEAGAFPGRMIVAALADEEGMMLGAKGFVAAGHAEGIDGAIVCEPEGGEVCVCSKGAIRVRVRARGTMAHGAMPDRGRNPIPALTAFLTEVADLQAALQDRVGVHPHLGRPYLTPTVVQAGTVEQVNVIPATAEAALDVRTVPGVDHAELLDRLRGLATRVTQRSGVTLTLEVIDDRPPVQIPDDHPLAQALCAAHAEVTGEPAVLGGVPGTTDGTILHRDAGVPVVVYGPGGKWIAHQANEYVELSDLRTHAEVYARAALHFLHQRDERRTS